MLALVNSTLSGNRSTGDGGGLWSSGTSALTFTTVASNSSRSGGGGIHSAGGSLVLRSTLVAHNGMNCNAALTSNDYNLEYGHSCGLAQIHDLADIDPFLGSLTADSGTWVHPLLAGSLAIDQVACVAGITTDQRGAHRPNGFACDIGAYEAAPRLRNVYLPIVVRPQGRVAPAGNACQASNVER